MDSHRTVIKHYAILIGIDAYPDRPLNACVQDVQQIKESLQGQTVPIDIQTFTATRSANTEFSFPTEDQVFWPTYHNVISAFEKTTSLAKPGDFVYIHYSGHGTRAEPDSEHSNTSTGDLALVLLDGDKGDDVRYLWGPRMAFSLKAMVEKALVVTIVLDCCFSASVYRRNDSNIRFLPYDAETDSKFPLDQELSVGDETRGSGKRNASMLPNWLINPDQYGMLTSCGPQEEASEFITRDGQMHGASSYFLLPLIKSGGFTRKHKDIYRQLRTKFGESWPQQNPVFYGNKEQHFFGHDNSEGNTVPVSIYRSGGGLQLQAGQAHGVCDGDQFALCPLDSAENTISDSKGDIVVARVTHAGGLTSNLELLSTSTIHAHAGLIAKPIMQAFLRRLPIRLASDLPHLDELFTTLKERSLDIHIENDEKACPFHLVLYSSEGCKILDEYGEEMINLPTMSQYQADISHICDIIEHLVRYRLVRDLVNKASADPFLDTFNVHITNRLGKVFLPGCLVEVEEDKKAKFMLELQVENKGKNTLYLYIYNMSPFWQVEDIYRGSYEAIPPRNLDQGFTGVSRKRLKTMVPARMKENGHCACEDVVKVFVTSQPTSFDFLELPKLVTRSKETPKVGLVEERVMRQRNGRHSIFLYVQLRRSRQEAISSYCRDTAPSPQLISGWVDDCHKSKVNLGWKNI